MYKENPDTFLRRLNILLWLTQIFMAIVFLVAGAIKLTQPIAVLANKLSWVNNISPALIRFIGLVEVYGAIGLLLPSIMRIKPKLTIWASLGLLYLMISAIFFHISIGQSDMIALPAFLAANTVFIIWGRIKKVPITITK